MVRQEANELTSDRRNLVVVGASAGGVEALRSLVAALPSEFPGAVIVVMHLPAGGTSSLPMILDRAGPLPAVAAADGLTLRSGTIYVATPDQHVLLDETRLVLAHGPTENGHRPAINALFRSAAVCCGPRVTSIVLSGVLDDGAAGVRAITGRGGATMVQDPADALYSAMPRAALRQVDADHVLAAGAMGPVLDKLVRDRAEVDSAPQPSSSLLLEDRIARSASVSDQKPEGQGEMTGYSCPDCQGTLVELESGGGNYRCRVGHAWSAEALHAAQGHELQRALWMALRSLDEKASLSRRLEEEARSRGTHTLVTRYRESADESAQAAEVLRNYLVSFDSTAPEEVLS